MAGLLLPACTARREGAARPAAPDAAAVPDASARLAELAAAEPEATPTAIDPKVALPARLDALVAAAAGQASRMDDPAVVEAIAAIQRAGGPSESPPDESQGGWRRWEIRVLPGHTTASYAKQLDYFGIELGVLGPEGEITYVANLSEATPATRRGNTSDETRCYITWDRGDLDEADREILAKAGIDPAGRIVLKFLPPPVERILAELERRHAARHGPPETAMVFGIRAAGSGYEFFVDTPR